MKGPRESSAGSEPATGTRRRTWLAAASGVAALVFSLHFFKPANGQESLVSAEEAVLLKQTEKLRDLVMAAEKGPLVDCDQILVVVDQGVVQDLLISVLPLEGDVGGGFHIRLDSADAGFGDGLALIRLEGEASVPGQAASAHLTVLCGLDTFQIAPDTGRLKSALAVYGVEVKRADILGLDERGIARALTHGGLDALLHTIEIPVSFENRLALPEVRSQRLRIPATDVPLRVEVSKVRAFGGKVWVCLGTTLSAPAPNAEGASAP
jgi:hypothetical protein